jgi:hypothetical protein
MKNKQNNTSPCRLEDLEPVLGRTKVEISYQFNHVIDYLYNTHNHLLSDLSRDWLSYEHLRNYAEAVSDRNTYFSTGCR